MCKITYLLGRLDAAGNQQATRPRVLAIAIRFRQLDESGNISRIDRCRLSHHYRDTARMVPIFARLHILSHRNRP